VPLSRRKKAGNVLGVTEGHAPSSRTAAPVVPGQVIGGKFRVERVIGEGGMGIVCEATHLGLDERVALKFLRREVMALPDVVARFDREARAAVKLKSEHVARVSDVGKTDDGIPFMVMELLAGKDLADLLHERGPLPIAEAVEYVIQACEGVGEAHARGIVHRDLKPENLFVVMHEGWASVKVLDFGISKVALVGPSSVDMQSSNTANIMGSPHYMSPEQLRSTRTVDHRADVWSLGIVLFELLTGATAFDEANDFTGLVAEILESPHRRLRAYRPDAPAELEVVVDRCLEKDRAKRFQNMAELAVALLPFAPRRARVTAERTTAISRAAGLISDPTFQLPPSAYPPPMSAPMSSSDSYPTEKALRAPNVPNGLAPYPAPPQSTPSLPAGSVPAFSQRRKQVSPPALVLGALALLGTGVGLAYGVIRAIQPAPAASQPFTTAAPRPAVADTAAPSATSTGTPTAMATASAATADTASATVSATASSTVTARPPSTSHHVVHTRPTATTTSAHPTLDIQLTR
jgi:serine/threonine protein kinase